MAKYDPAIEKAGAKLLTALKALPKAVASPGSFLMSIVRGMVLPAFPAIIAELLKTANAKTRKILAVTRDILIGANLGDA